MQASAFKLCQSTPVAPGRGGDSHLLPLGASSPCPVSTAVRKLACCLERWSEGTSTHLEATAQQANASRSHRIELKTQAWVSEKSRDEDPSLQSITDQSLGSTGRITRCADPGSSDRHRTSGHCFHSPQSAGTARILRKAVRAICQGLIPFTFSSYSHPTAALLPVLLTINSGAIMPKCKLPRLKVLHHFPQKRSKL